MRMKTLRDISSKGADFILKNFLPMPKNAITLLSASGGTGKTRLALLLADRYIVENDFNTNVGLWLTEDYPGQVKESFEQLIKNDMVNEKSLDHMVIILENPPQLAKREQGLFKANYEEINKIGEELIKANITFAVFDPLLAFYGGNENDNSEARVFIQGFAEWAKESEITTLIIHHANKDGASRGATAFHDGVRARYELCLPMDDEGEVNQDLSKNGFRIAKLKKDNWGIRKYLWNMTDGKDEILIKVMPKLQYETQREIPVEVVEFQSDDIEDFGNNDFMGGIL